MTEMKRVLKTSPSMTLIDLELNCLVQSPEHVKYTCLSYVWGHSANAFNTTKENLHELLQPGAFIHHATSIPLTIRHAMIVTKRLGIRFLWVDRFCIVQDNEATLHEQIKWMASIYAYSYFTIIAASGSDDQYGLPGVVHPRKLHRITLNLNNSAQFAVSDFAWNENDDTYSSRAWTFQERLLSSRCLVFYQNTVKWECRESTSFEILSHSSQTESSRVSYPYGPKLMPDPGNFSTLVKSYTKRNLTFEKDTMNAFDPIIRYLTPAFPGGFFYGLPEGAFHAALRWEPWKPWEFGTHLRRDEFPSWSWLGWKGESTLPYSATSFTADRKFYISEEEKLEIPLVDWYKQERDTQNTVPIRNFCNQWRSFEYSSNDKFHVDVSQEDPKLRPSDLCMWSPFLFGRVQVGKLKMGNLVWEYWYKIPSAGHGWKMVWNCRAYWMRWPIVP